ncbi:hypothetical protein HY477_04220 [Candidatus Uhrbacteria bacterium]|nr:hypothetical protein [Candidatus Uhrbacteria bacterium]
MTNFGELIKKVLTLYSTNFKFVVGLTSVSLIWNIALILVPVSLATTMRYLIPVAAGSLIILMFTELALVSGFGSLITGSRISVPRAFLNALKYLPWFVVLFIVWLIVVMFGALFLIVPGIIFAVWFMFLSSALVLENKKGINAFKRSRHLVYGHTIGLFLRVFLVGAVLTAISEIAGRGFVYITNAVAPSDALPYLLTAGQLFSTVLSILIFPILPATIVTLYFEMKKLKG